MRFPAAALTLVFLLASSPVRAEPAGWGQPSNGLSLQATLGESQVPMGGVLELTLRFRYELPASNPFEFLNLGSWTARVVLTDRETGATFERDRLPTGFAAGGSRRPEDHVDLVEVAERHLSLNRHLLSPEGEQVPPGVYDAAIVYTNAGGSGMRVVYVSEEEPCREVPYPPGSLWRGTVISAPVRIDVLPAGPDTVEFEMPKEISVRVESDTFVWAFVDGRRTVRVARRPGHWVVPYMTVHYQIGDEASPEFAAGGTMQEWWHWKPGSLRKATEQLAAVSATNPLRVSVGLSIRERPPGHGRWNPFDTRFAIWSDSLSARWP